MSSRAGMPSLRRQVAISHLAGAMAGAAATMLGPILPVLSRTWSMSDAAAGALLASEFAGGFCGAMVSGWLSARYSQMALLTAGLALLFAGYAGAGLVLQPWMPVCLFLCGLGTGFINPMANLIVSRAGRPSPEAALNLFAFSWAAGALITPYAIGFFLRQQPVARIFLGLALPAVPVAVAAALSMTRAETAVAESRAPVAPAGMGMFTIATGVLLFLYVGVETSVSVWLPTGAGRWAAVGPARAAAAQSIFWATLLSGRLMAPWWLRRLAPGRLVLAGLLCAAAGTGVLLAASGFGTLAAGAGLAGLGLAPVNPIMVAAFITRLGPAAARWAGPVFASAGLGGAAIPWLVGATSAHFDSLRAGFAAPLVAIAAMVVLEFRLGRSGGAGRIDNVQRVVAK